MKRQFSLLFIILSLNTASFASHSSFSPAEHETIGDNVKLFFSDNDPGQTNVLLPLPNELNLSYGNILVLGDFYGTPSQSIAQGRSENEKQARFMAAFNSFAGHHADIIQLLKILAVIQHEKNYITDGMKKGETEENLYNKIGLDFDRQFNCITGGGCDSTWWTRPGRYLLLLRDDYDHFGNDAWESYRVGHDIAIQEAIKAHQTNDINKLKYAYAMNAFASHFLTDRFATGHMRTPRKALPDNVTPSLVGHLLVNFMHNEENVNGLHVHNANGEQWLAYGDKSYYSERTAEHRKKIMAAVQLSADQLFFAYQHGSAPDNNEVKNLIPLPNEINNAANLDISPLFYWDNIKHKVMRRENLKNTYDRRWTDNWWGWSTLYELNDGKGLPFDSQAILAMSNYRQQAIQYGLITDKSITDYLNTQHVHN